MNLFNPNAPINKAQRAVKRFKQAAAMVLLMAINTYQASANDVPVYVTKVEQRQVSPTQKFPGRVISDNTITLAAQVSGRLTAVLPLGSEVKQGQVIAQIDDTLFKIDEQKAHQAIKNIQAQQKLTQNERKRVSALADEKYASDSLIDKLDTELRLIEGKLTQAKLDLAHKTALLARTQIKAPFDGVIAHRLKKAGEWIESSHGVVNLIDTKQTEISLLVPSDFAAKLHSNNPVSIITNTGSYQGELRTKVPQTDFKFYELRVTVVEQPLQPGMSVNVGFAKQGATEQHIAVPRDALQVRNGTLGVFRINKENLSEYVSVKALAIEDGWSAIEGELSQGDTIVIRGVERLSHGQNVKILNPQVALIDSQKTN